MKKIVYIIFIVLLSEFAANAQQMPQYSQYMFNDFIVNPAVAGSKEYYQARSNNRYQWIGIVDAPKTYILSIYGPDKKKDIGYGGYAFNDVVGPTSRTGIYGAYSYNFLIDGNVRLSLGLAVGLLQFKIDGSKVILHDDGDPSFGDAMYVKYTPDATFGSYIYAPKYYGGLGFSQLFGNKIKFKDVESIDHSNLKQHLFMNAGYFYDINDDFTLEPSFMFKAVWPVPVHFDIAARCIYKELVWLGTSFRTGFVSQTMDAFNIMIGYNHEDQILIGYSYDMTLSNIKNYSSGTHELMIGFRFNKIKKSMSRAKIN